MEKNISDNKTDTDVSPVVEKANDKEDYFFTPRMKNSESDVSNKNNNLSSITQKIEQVNLNALVPFRNHPFEPYIGKRFNALVESIRYNGVHIPIIIRPIEDGKYEILSGHNRVRASKEAEKEIIPAIILSGLTEEEAWLVVTDTNLYQRSTTDMNPSELAMALSAHYEATKKQGSRTTMIKLIEEIVSVASDPDTSGAMRQKYDTRKEIGAIYGMSSRNVGYYIRINKLVNPLKKRLDKGEFAKRTAVALSHLSDKDQNTVDKFLTDTNHCLMENEAEYLRKEAKNGALTPKKIKEILGKPKPAPITSLNLKSNHLKEFFDLEKQKPQDIENEILEALRFYRTHNTAT